MPQRPGVPEDSLQQMRCDSALPVKGAASKKGLPGTAYSSPRYVQPPRIPVDSPAGREQSGQLMADIKVYLDGDGTPEGTVLANYYQSYQQENGTYDHPGMEAIRFAKYLLEHLEEFQAELKDYMAIPWPDPPEGAGS
jgi:hypothetical protein